MTLTPAFLDELRARTQLSALIGKSVKLTRAGREMRAPCPFHNEKTPSFYVNDDKGFYHCFGCSAHGDAIRWMTDQRGLPFIDAVKELAAAAGLEMPAPDRQSVQVAERAKGLHEAMDAAAEWFAGQFGGLEGAAARDLLKRRGVSEETRRRFGLGYAPDARGKLRAALKEFGDPLLIEAGLLIQVEGKEPYDRFRGRLTIPIRDPRGRVIAFGARVVGEGEPKYLNSPETPLFDKGRTLFNLDRAAPAARKANRLIVVEGYMDAIALDQAGIAEVVAPLGTALTEAQLERLWRVSDVPILCLDGDAAGQKAAVRAAHRALPMLAPGRSLSFVSLPDGHDPDDLVRQRGRGALDALLAEPEPLVERLWHQELAASPLRTPEDRAALGSRLRMLAKQITEDDLRRDYLATFNRMVWDHFHPERPSESFHRFKGTEPKAPVSPRLKAISQFGIDQVTIIPAAMKGLIRFPEVIAPIAERIGELPINSQRLRLTREHLLEEALRVDQLETAHLVAILRADGLQDVLDQMERVTLGFSFLSAKPDTAKAEKDLMLVIDAVAAGAAVQDDIQAAQRDRHRWSAEEFASFASMMRAKQDFEQVFRDALIPDDS